MNLIQSYLVNNPCYVANVNKADSRYVTFQQRGPLGLMLHSVGCAQPSAMVFINAWNKSTYDRACVHGFIDANTGDAYKCLPWNYRGWHGGGSSNNTHVGIEMCESKYIKYIPNTAAKFEILDKAKAQADCKRCYDTAVELFASICKEYNLNPLTAICSHKEGYAKGIATNHGDPEHYWKGLGMPYTMDGFRQDVKAEMEGEIDMTKEELDQLLDEKITAAVNKLEASNKKQLVEICTKLSEDYGKSLDSSLISLSNAVSGMVEQKLGKQIIHNDDIPWAGVRDEMRKLLDAEVINGGTSYEKDPDDINLPLDMVRVLVVSARYTETLIKQLKEELGIASSRVLSEA